MYIMILPVEFFYNREESKICENDSVQDND